MRFTRHIVRQVFFVCVLCSLFACSLAAQVVTTTVGGYIGDGGPATEAGLNYPRWMVQDAAGNIYLTDAEDHRIRKIAPDGIITTFAGTGIAGFSGDGGLARNAQLNDPTGIAFDAVGNLIITDQGNNRIRKIDTSGIITTIAGTGIAGYSGDFGPATLAELNAPFGLTLDTSGNVFFADANNCAIRKIDGSGVITTVAGNGIPGYNGDGIPATAAELNVPRHVAVDSSGNIYIADTANFRVRKVDTNGIITTFAGNGLFGFSGDGGLATVAEVGMPRGLLLLGNFILISNAGDARIRTVNLVPPNYIETFAGLVRGYDGDGNPPGETEFSAPTGMLFTRSGSLLVGDQFNARLREVTPAITTTKAGSFGPDDTRGNRALLIVPFNFAFDRTGNYYIAEWRGNRIRKFDAVSGKVTSFAGTGISGDAGDGGPAKDALLNSPAGVAADQSGNVYIADQGNLVIRKVSSDGTISTFASDPTFSDLQSLAADGAGNIYSADDGACVIRKITPTGVISVVAGNFVCGYNGDGISATSAELNGPFGVAVDTKGNLYIGDSANNRIRKVNPSGIISTIVGTGVCGFSGDGGSATLATICNPAGLVVNSVGKVYFADEFNLRIREVSAEGKITTVAGSGIPGYNGENLPATSANLDDPLAVGLDNAGTLFVLDDVQARVRKVH
jgi:sugar lactone lactonase YvrE